MQIDTVGHIIFYEVFILTADFNLVNSVHFDSRFTWAVSVQGELEKDFAFLLEKGAPKEAEILERFRSLSKENKQALLTYSCSALRGAKVIHLAASLGCNELLKVILNSSQREKIGLNDADDLGNRALHHCALVGNYLGYTLLCRQGAVDACNLYGATASDLWQLTWREEAPSELSTDFYEKGCENYPNADTRKKSIPSSILSDVIDGSLKAHKMDSIGNIARSNFECSENATLGNSVCQKRKFTDLERSTVTKIHYEKTDLVAVKTRSRISWEKPEMVELEGQAKGLLVSRHLSSITEILPLYMQPPLRESELMRRSYEKVVANYPLQGFYLDKDPLTGGVLKSSQSYAVGDPIVVWFGEFHIELENHLAVIGQEDCEYSLAPYYNEQWRCPASMMEDGFPFIVGYEIKGVSGLRTDIVFFAGETIAPNTVLSFDYGPLHKIKFGPHIERYWPDLVSFLTKEEGSQALADPADRLSLTLQAAIARKEEAKAASSEEYWSSKLAVDRYGYLLATPTTQLLILTSGAINRDGFLRFLENAQELIKESEGCLMSRLREKKRFWSCLIRWSTFLDKAEDLEVIEKGIYFNEVKELTERNSLPAISDWLESEIGHLDERISYMRSV